MSLESILTKVDEATWKQYEKVTDWAYKNYGWSKYDLAKSSIWGEGISICGVYTYLGISGFNYNPTKWLTVLTGVCCSLTGILYANTFSKGVNSQEQIENETLTRTEAVYEPRFDAWRPLALGFTTSLGSLAIIASCFMNQENVESLELQKTIVRLMGIGLSTCGFCHVSAGYFLSQIPKPPKAKKSAWQALYEPVTKYFRKVVPQLEPKPEGANSSA